MMKKIKWIIPAVIAGVILVILTALLCVALRYGATVGYYLEAKDGVAMIIEGKSPTVMSSRSDRDIFKRLESGDKILILHDAVAESYPGRTRVHAVIKLKNGDKSDLPADVIGSLMKMGWIDGGYEAAFTSPDEAFPIHVAYAGWTEIGAIYANALNSEKFSQDGAHNLPIYRFDTVADIEAFRSTFENDLAFEYGFGEFGTFNDTIAMYEDEAFLENYSLMLVYVKADSGSYRYGVESIYCNGESFRINVEELTHSELVTLDLAGWYVIVVVPDMMVDHCSDFDAALVH